MLGLAISEELERRWEGDEGDREEDVEPACIHPQEPGRVPDPGEPEIADPADKPRHKPGASRSGRSRNRLQRRTRTKRTGKRKKTAAIVPGIAVCLISGVTRR